MDTIGNDAITAAAKASPLQATYGQTVDRDSAYEQLAAKLAPPPSPEDSGGFGGVEASGEIEAMPAPAQPAEPGVLEQVLKSSAFKSAMRSAGTVIGREITRSIFGTGRRR